MLKIVERWMKVSLFGREPARNEAEVDASGNVMVAEQGTPNVNMVGPLGAAGDGILNVSYPAHQIYGGNYFFIQGAIDVAAADATLLFVVPNSLKWPYMSWVIEAQGEMEWRVYEGVTTSTDGSALTIFNANRNSATTAGCTAFSGPTLNSGALGDGGEGGTLLRIYTLGAGRQRGLDRSSMYHIIAKQNTKYWINVENIAGGTLWFHYDFHWFEHEAT